MLITACILFSAGKAGSACRNTALMFWLHRPWFRHGCLFREKNRLMSFRRFLMLPEHVWGSPQMRVLHQTPDTVKTSVRVWPSHTQHQETIITQAYGWKFVAIKISIWMKVCLDWHKHLTEFSHLQCNAKKNITFSFSPSFIWVWTDKLHTETGPNFHAEHWCVL